MRRALYDESFRRIAQAAKKPLKEETSYDVNESVKSMEEIYRLLSQITEEGNLTVQQIEDLEIQIWELQEQVNSIIEWGSQSVEWSNDVAQFMNDLQERVQSLEEKPSSAVPSVPDYEGFQWWENYLKENPYPYPTTYF